MSVVLVTVSGYSTLAKTIAHLRAQTIKEQLELVLVSSNTLQVDEDALRDFWGCQTLVVDSIGEVAVGLAAGIRCARAPIVACGEDHAYPNPLWAEALLRAHEGPYAAVGPVMRNANPQTAVSRAGLLLSFGRWMRADLGGEVDHLPGHNTSYKRDCLLHYGDDLAEWLKSERALHYDLVARGERLYMTSEGEVAHVNISRLRPYLGHSLMGGRIFGAARSAGWSPLRRVLYALAFPVVPIVRLRRLMVLAHQSQDGVIRKTLIAALPMVLVGLIVHAVGEAFGYMFGEGGALAAYARFELYRFDHVVESERNPT
jgi:hypothetical protein